MKRWMGVTQTFLTRKEQLRMLSETDFTRLNLPIELIVGKYFVAFISKNSNFEFLSGMMREDSGLTEGKVPGMLEYKVNYYVHSLIDH